MLTLDLYEIVVIGDLGNKDRGIAHTSFDAFAGSVKIVGNIYCFGFRIVVGRKHGNKLSHLAEDIILIACAVALTCLGDILGGSCVTLSGVVSVESVGSVHE